ncbi:MAG: NAD(+)/NADH kinase [Gammaproteobacteria bacterium]|nr:NAD(+)/NADH kinase [Gammaproteobacteria bacterium]
MFNTIGIITKPKDFTSEQTGNELSVFLEKQGITLVEGADAIKESADLIIVVGGDGTILNTARTFVDNGIPILGINLGHLGFLVDLAVERMTEAVSEILEGKYIKERRALLSCQIERKDKIILKNLAFNEVVIHRNHVPKMLDFDLYVNGDFVNNQRSDGIIIATPTGSTAYSLSSGGPIVHPSVNAITLVSICPHTMSHRPIVLHGESEVLVHVLDSPDRATISFDGQSSDERPSIPKELGDRIRVRQHENFVHLIHPKRYDYFKIIRSKLHWGRKV